MRRMLMEVTDDCAHLVLDDGSTWMVDPIDMPTVCTWLPITGLRIVKDSNSRLFTHRVENLSNGVTIWARPLA